MTVAKKMIIADEAHKTLSTLHRPKVKLLADYSILLGGYYGTQ